ncbi:MAG: hypothetical protein M1813_003551 [Trichoglossum hirsutum]|nr:MAG: hypothetical protein M1813_003551 [Trichoglossum hirsutum]
MASAKKRDRGANFLDLGVAGRRTGVTLKDTGVRDEHGLEPIEGIFSSPARSPEKSPTKSNGAARNSTITTEEEMEIGNSTVPEPTNVLSERRRTIVPPPRARSPIKTFLNTPAKRGSSIGPISSPFRRINEAGAVAAASVNRKLNFSAMDQPSSRLKLSQTAEEATLDPLPSTEAEDSNFRTATGSTVQGEEEEDGGEDGQYPREFKAQEAHTQQGDHEGAAGEDMDDFLPLVQEDDTIDLVEQDTTEPQQNYVSSSNAAMPAPIPRRGPGRPRKSDPTPTASTPTASTPTATTAASKRGRGRPPKYRPAVIKEETSEYEDARPPKRRRDSSVELVPPASKRRATKMPPPSRRDPKARITSGKRSSGVSNVTKPEDQGLPEPASEPRKRGRPKKDPQNPQNPALKPRSLYITRRETPTEDGALRTRSGRTSVRPCAYWRNERIVYGEGDNREGEGYLLPTIKEVIRTEEVEQQSKRARRRGANAGRKKRTHTEESGSEDDDDDDDELEAWEVDPGIVTGEVERWDDELERTSDLLPVPTEIAYSSSAIETVPVPNSTFRYSKIISLDFYGAGMVDLPPGGQKRLKNSRKMHMAFFVHRGRVRVEVAGTSFSIGVGGMWQVPRGASCYATGGRRRE